MLEIKDLKVNDELIRDDGVFSCRAFVLMNGLHKRDNEMFVDHDWFMCDGNEKLDLSEYQVKKDMERLARGEDIEKEEKQERLEKEIMAEREIMDYLGVSAHILAGYREDGLKFSQLGGKRFYLFENVLDFMRDRELRG